MSSHAKNNVLSLPLRLRAEMAFRAAVEKVHEENARLGLPVYVWRDGEVVELSAQQLRAGLRPRHAKK